ncbi:MAG: MOSC domain-containing protein [Bacteroidota bacterium]
MKLDSIFVGKPRQVENQGKMVTTGIFKEKITGPVGVTKLNVEGDQQADLKVHGGVEKAVYAYPSEHYQFWKEKRPNLAFGPGRFGENLSITGLSEKDVCIGDTYKIGSVVFMVKSPRMPCFKLGIKMNDPRFVKDFMDANLTGFYFCVLEEGEIEAGNRIEKIDEDGHGLTVDETARLYALDKDNNALLRKAASSPSLPTDWVEFYQKRLDK